MVGLLSLPRTVRLLAFVSTISPWGRAASRPPAAAGLHLSSGFDKVSLNWHWITHLPSFLPHNVNWLANSHSKAEMSDNWRKQGNVWKYFIIMIREGDKRYFRVSKVGKTVVYLNLSNTLLPNYLPWPNKKVWYLQPLLITARSSENLLGGSPMPYPLLSSSPPTWVSSHCLSTT